MGRIKSLIVKKTAKQLLEEAPFNESFDNNKKILKDTMPSKPIRNKIAGYMARLCRMKKEKEQMQNGPATPATAAAAI